MSWGYIGAAAVTAVVASSEAEKSRKAAAGQFGAALTAQEKQAALVQEQTRPYRETGGRALSMLEQMTTGDYDITKTPGYEFRLEEGYKGLERSQAGRRLGGRAAKEATRYGQDYASAEYGAEFGRLSELARMGLAGTGQSISGGGQATAGMANIYGQGAELEYQAGRDRSEIYQQTGQNVMTAWELYNQRPKTTSYYNQPAPSSAVQAGDAYAPAYRGYS